MRLPLSKIAGFTSAPTPPATNVGTAPPRQAPLSAVRESDDPRGEVAQGYSIDSRTIGPGELFFAVKGERLDGHDYVNTALEKGAAAAVVGEGQLHRYPEKTRLLAVDD